MPRLKGLIIFISGLFLGLSLVTYHRWDPSLLTYTESPVKNLGGIVGAYLGDAFISLIGVGAFFVALFLIATGVKRIMGMERNIVQFAGAIMFVFSTSLLASMVDVSLKLDYEYGPGGLFGTVIGRLMIRLLSDVGAYVVMLPLFFCALVLLLPMSVLSLIMKPRPPRERRLPAPRPLPAQQSDAEVNQQLNAAAVIAAQSEGALDIDDNVDVEEEDEEGDDEFDEVSFADLNDEPEASAPAAYETADDAQGITIGGQYHTAVQHEDAELDDALDDLFDPVNPVDVEVEVEDSHANPVVIEYDEPDPDLLTPLGALPEDPDLESLEAAGVAGKAKKRRKYQLPDLAFLNAYESTEKSTREELLSSATLLEQKLGDFNVKGKVTHVHAGPVVTLNEFEPAPGVKINKVVSLAEDLALTLKAVSIRISAVPGKAAIGIEVPNAHRETVSLKEILSAESFKSSKSPLTMALGKDIFGTPVVADLKRMPHLLVAGATGSGKSVFMNSLILSLMYKSTPDELKMVMIDPKLIELSVYNGIPHLISPVVTDPKDASEMLRRMVFEMERRYRLIADMGVRNIDSYNESVSPEQRLPFIVIFIDELADLMLASSAQVEDSIARLAQMARASGMHLIIATQRPSVDVITGVIKANFPARVAFQVTTKVDSRTILDAQGAEQLIGRGDMLFMLPGVKLLRVHGAFVTESEVRNVVEFTSAQREPDYAIMQSIIEAAETVEAEKQFDGDRDELFWKAVEFGEQAGEVSISSIQRRLKVGYNRAARIMEVMEEDGLVGPPKAAGKPRDFLGRKV